MVSIIFCFKLRYLQPPSQWVACALESRELLALCLKKLKGLNKVLFVMPCWSHFDGRICVSLAYYLPKPNRVCPLKVMIVNFEMLLVYFCEEEYFSCYKIMVSFAFRNLITAISICLEISCCCLCSCHGTDFSAWKCVRHMSKSF